MFSRHGIPLVMAALAFCLFSTQAFAFELEMPGDSLAKRKAKVTAGSGWLTQGAEILPMNRKAFEFRAGFPSTDFGVHIPVAKSFELIPFWTLDYLPYGVWFGVLGDTFGVSLKGCVWSRGPHAISLGADIGLIMMYLPGFNIGVQIGGPEFRYSHRWNKPRIAVITGFRMPIRVWGLAVSAEIPMLFNIGFEYNVIKNLNIHSNLEFGPTVVAAPGGVAGVGGHAGFQFGISYLF
ncbi:MAG TPA: hypothetical protein PKG98_04540 [Myxococcota bacterium]|nr:hypothetical protein [Myxococcota bacterium]